MFRAIGFWAPTVAGLSVSATANGDANTNNGTCYVGVQFNSSGVEYERNASTGAYNISQGNWLVSGTAAEVWVEFIRTAGAASFDGISNSTRYQLSTTRSFGITDAGGFNSISGYFVFHDAATGGNILQTTSTVTWSALDLDI
jgi:hypothetical protein